MSKRMIEQIFYFVTAKYKRSKFDPDLFEKKENQNNNNSFHDIKCNNFDENFLDVVKQ